MNRLVDPAISFTKGSGAYIWDSDGKKYIDFHAAFAPHILGHNHPAISEAVVAAINEEKSLFGSGPVDLEGELARRLCSSIDAVDKVTLLNTGSEATALAIKLSRAITGRSHFIVMQGGYNGNTDELACNVFNTLEEIGPRVSPGEYPIRPLGPGTEIEHQHLVHVVNFNDLDSVRYVCERYPVAALITEPVLQNIGVVSPEPGYLEGLRALADELGFLLVFDEVKTGFRQGIGGYAAISKVKPDLATYGKAIANGYPISILGGRADYMDRIADVDPAKRPLVAGTYNGHPVGVAAAIATLDYLADKEIDASNTLNHLGELAEDGINTGLKETGTVGVVARHGSAFSIYYMDHKPKDFHDLLLNHNFDLDLKIRRALIKRGIYFVPVATKQCSISLAHSHEDIEQMVEAMTECLKNN